VSGGIVSGFDGTSSGEDALTLAARVGRAMGVPPVVVCVYPEESPIGPGRVDAEWVAYMHEQANETSAAARAFLEARGVEAEYRVVGSGSAAHALDDVAEEEGATMIVVGSSRRGVRRRISPGSTGERLLHGCGCPVAVAPVGMRERPVDAPVQRIGVAYVDAPEAHEALRFASGLAQGTGARLILYSVVARRAEVYAPIMGRDSEDAFLVTLREDAEARLDAAVAALPDGVEAEHELLTGDVVDELSALDEREIDLLACGSRNYGPVRRVLLGGVSRQLVRHAASPVVIVPRADD
jgi:nucleotide-binding universal stress UspA family protein